MKNLTKTHPHLLKEWDYDRNGIDPKSLSAGSHKIVWWKCDVANDHRWKASILNRALKNSTCPCCCNRKVVPSNCLATTHPHLASQWNNKNTLKPTEFTSGSSKRVWWLCSVAKDHQWQTTIVNRTRRGDGCPFCSSQKPSSTNNLKIHFPKILNEWDYDKNEIKPEQILPNSMKKVWWKCKKNPEHNWKASPNNRVCHKFICPFCTGKRADSKTSLSARHKSLLKEWDYDLNKRDPNTVLPNSHKKFWWKCKNDFSHKWKANPNNRVANKSRCPFCFNSSKGENAVKQFLKDSEIEFIKEHRFPDCRDKTSLPFDFAVIYNKKIVGLIEFQGQQHYFPVSIFGGDKSHKRQTKRDKIKKDYCKSNSIPLLEIKYDQVTKIPKLITNFVKLKND